MLCVWWDQSSIVYYKLLEHGKTVNAERYHQQMINLNHALIEKRPEWAKRHGKVILLHDIAPSHTSKLANDTLKSLGCDTLSPPLYFFDLAASDYHLFSSMGYALAEQHFSNFEEV
jgi:Transposase.